MSIRKRTSTTRLPQSLLDEINAKDGSSDRGNKRTSRFSKRKEERKAERHHAKQRKAQFFAHKAEKPNSRTHSFNEPKERKYPHKKVKVYDVAQHEVRRNKNGETEGGRRGARESTERKESKRTSSSVTELRGAAVKVPQKRSRVEEQEDAYIELLERELRIKKDKKGKSKYGSGFDDDGLLDLLVDLDDKVFGSTSEQMDEGSEVEEGLEDRETSETDRSDPSEQSDGGVDKEEDDIAGSASEDDTDEDDGDGKDEEENEEESPSRQPVAVEPTRQSSGSKYVPPHLRKQQEDKSEVDVKLIRQLKGLLNRLSEQNIDSILKEVENLYRSHKRHDITATMTNLIIEGTCSHSILLDSYVALHAGLVACLHKIIGVELAAYFVQNVVSNFEHHYQKAKERSGVDSDSDTTGDSNIGKECSNLLVLLSDLYNYHVISCALVYDIIRLILDGNLSELDVELVLKLARGSGLHLRQDDPTALKDIIQIVQSKLGDQRETSSRTRFMVETLVNLKNNKWKRAAGDAQGGSESKERINKFVSGIGKKYHVHAHEPLRVSLEDLHQADSKGKWWLVGAAWGGDPLVEQQASSTQSSMAPGENALLKLARKQGMNTDVRRSVFVVLMSSDDYVDACDRLAQLSLTEVQQREIIRVLLHCCGNEKSYNPYYTLIASHLCRQTHSHKVTLQYCFWDFLRNLGQTSVGGAEMAKSFEEEQDEPERFELDRVSSTRMANVARFYAWLVAKDCVAITILKTLNFIDLKSKTRTFLKNFFTHLFSNSQDSSPVPSLSVSIDESILARRDEKALIEILSKAARIPTLPSGILLFLSTAFAGRGDTGEPTETFIQWCCDVARDAFHNVDPNLMM